MHGSGTAGLFLSAICIGVAQFWQYCLAINASLAALLSLCCTAGG
jgi:hypothetical protein